MPHFDTFPNNSISYTIDTLVMLIFVLIIITKNNKTVHIQGGMAVDNKEKEST